MFLNISIYLSVAALTCWILSRYLRKTARDKNRAHETLQKSESMGLTEPVSLHPKIDPVKCICAGACLSACPEGDILGLVNGRAELVSPTKCIGHGACEEACPVNAIELVFGTERRGVDIPNVNERFETNVPGMYIAGELGGMGLIRNAVTQGREAVDYIVESLAAKKSKVESPPELFDLLIVGAGPAGIAATLRAKEKGIKYITVEQDDVGGAALSYPRQKLVMTQPMQIPIYGRFKKTHVEKEELLDLWSEVIELSGVTFCTGQKVENIAQEGDCFVVTTTTSAHRAKSVLLAIGRRGSPRKLGVPGENSPKVTYKLLEPEQYANKHSLVVGGGNSAAEAALALCEQPGAVVSLSCRGAAMEAANEENREKLNKKVAEGRLTIFYNADVKEILETSVQIKQNEKTVEIDNDFVFVFIGGELPTRFLNQVGVAVETKFGQR